MPPGFLYVARRCRRTAAAIATLVVDRVSDRTHSESMGIITH
jgi:hypothetical protein